MDGTGIIWWLGRRIPKPVGDAIARTVAPVVALRPPAAVGEWAATVERATGVTPSRRQHRRLVESWLRNNLWSLRLSEWSADEALRWTLVSEADEAKLKDSLAGPGLVLALPHMGSWDAAGVWSAAVGLNVVSVAERLPKGLYERFRDAREAMGMTIYPVGEPDLMTRLAVDVRARRMVCLLSDRDLSSRGVRVAWPKGRGTVSVPAGPALLAQRTGADLRVVTTHFDGPHLRLEVSERLGGSTAGERMTAVVAEFAAAVERHPESWLMLRQVFVDEQS